MRHTVDVDGIKFGQGRPPVLIAGPCVIETFDETMQAAAFLKEVTDELEIPFVFKSSFDKANRTSVESYRGPGLERGLDILAAIKERLGVRLISDVHQFHEIGPASQVLDILQIPAFLCRQTDFVQAVAEAGKPVNIKKGQFIAPWDMEHVVEKIVTAGNDEILLTERGTCFGYNNLVVDFRSLAIMQLMGRPVIFDATHSVQLPGGEGKTSGGQREFVPPLARAAVAAGVEGVFIEVHKNPHLALCDGPNSLPFNSTRILLKQLKAIRSAALFATLK
jgi:2-dehydro-3-deoxyphosphooctonate aldolase (KDO 8-P synthase)